MREIEVKLKVKDLEQVAKRLKADGYELSAPIEQQDFIYSKKGDVSVWDNIKEGQMVMRLRRENGRTIFNLKQQRSNESDNLEIETEVADPQAIHQILEILGYTPQVEINKTRRKAKFGEYEICLDKVEGLGTFVELEKLTDDDVDANKIQEELFTTLESLGLSRADQETRGYDTQMYQLTHK